VDRHVIVVVPKHLHNGSREAGLRARRGPVFLSLPSASQPRLDSIKPPFIAQDLHHALHDVSQDVQRHFGADVLQGPYLAEKQQLVRFLSARRSSEIASSISRAISLIVAVRS
jgi:hypothetical protein